MTQQVRNKYETRLKLPISSVMHVIDCVKILDLSNTLFHIQMGLLSRLRWVCSRIIYSFIIWSVLTTSIPELFPEFQLNEVSKNFQNKNIQLLIAHPDDEVMFFAPTLIELNKPIHNNNISVICFSTGNDKGLGSIRHDEVIRSLEILNIKNVQVLNNELKFKDSMELEWKSEDILEYVDDSDLILTFDSIGVSDHPNHKSLFNAVKDLNKPLLTLKSWNVFVKYSSTVLTNYELILKYLSKFFDKKISIYNENEFPIFADLPSSILSTAAMANGHYSQMVWFRWGWLIVSRYGNTNVLTYYK